MLEVLKYCIPVVFAIIAGVVSVIGALKNNKLTRSQKIDEVLIQAVNIAEQLGHLGKVAAGTKLDYALNYASSKIKLTAAELESAKQFIENSFVAFFNNPTLKNDNNNDVPATEAQDANLPTNAPINVIG